MSDHFSPLPEALDAPATLAEHLARVPRPYLVMVALAWLLEAAEQPATEAEAGRVLREYAATFQTIWDGRHPIPPAEREPAPPLDLAALPAGSVVLDASGTAWQARAWDAEAVWWWPALPESDHRACPGPVLAARGPLSLLHTAGVLA